MSDFTWEDPPAPTPVTANAAKRAYRNFSFLVGIASQNPGRWMRIDEVSTSTVDSLKAKYKKNIEVVTRGAKAGPRTIYLRWADQ